MATVNEAARLLKLHRRLDDFDGEPHLAEHRELVAAIDAGEGRRLEAAITQ